MTLRAERQSAQMSKITQDALQLYLYGNSGRQRVNGRIIYAVWLQKCYCD